MATDVHTAEPGASSLTLDELRDRKRSILHAIDEAEQRVEELQRQARMYTEAADKLANRLHAAESQAREAATRGDSKTADGLRHVAAEIRALHERNRRLAAERAHIADGRQAEIGHHAVILGKVESLMQRRLETMVFGAPLATNDQA